MVDITNDGQQSSTDPIMELDEKTGRVKGGAHFAASFGPGRYRAFACVDFKGDGYDIVRYSSFHCVRMGNLECQGAPTEFGAWLGNFPVKNTWTIRQLYSGMSLVGDEFDALLIEKTQVLSTS